MAVRQEVRFSRAPTAFHVRRPLSHQAAGADVEQAAQAAMQNREEQILKNTERMQETLDSLQSAIEEFEQRRQQSLTDLQQLAVELAVMAASHVVRAELQRDVLGVEVLVTEAIAHMGILEAATVRIHSQDLDLLQAQLNGRVPPWNEGLISIVADQSVDRGAVRLETESGRVVLSDAVTRLNRIHDLWMEKINDAQVEQRSVSGDAQSVRRFPDRRETA